MLIPYRGRLCAGLSFVTLLFASTTLQAQLEEVVVTAQKREQNLQDVPMAVTAISAELLENNEIGSIEELTQLVPSLKYTPGDNPQNSSIRVRGVGTDVYSSAVEPNVSVVVDGVPLARTSLVNFDFADVERVEVLRGPQGTLFGKNASAGLVHVITRDPHEQFEARLKLGHETAEHFPGDDYKVQATVSGPLLEGLGARLTTYWKSTEGHIEDVAQGEFVPDREAYGVRAKLRWDVSDLLSLKLTAEHQNVDGSTYPSVSRSANPEVEANNDPINASETNRQTRSAGNLVSDMRSDAVTLSMDWTLGDFTLSAISGYREADLMNNLSAGPLDGKNIFLARNGGPRYIETFTQELRVAAAVDDWLEYTVGALWFDNYLSSDFDREIRDLPATTVANISLPSPLSPLDLPGNVGSIDVFQGFDNEVDTRNIGVFAQATWHIGSRWHLTAGVRHIDEEVSASYSNYQRLSDAATGTPISAADSMTVIPETTVADTDMTGTVSLQYDWGEHSMVYTTLSRGYRGRAFDITTNSNQDSFDNPVDPEIANSAELGVKSRLFGNRLEINATAFVTVFEDFQAQLVEIGGGGVAAELRLANAGELETRGVEIDFKAAPVKPVTIIGSLLFNRAVFNEFITQCFVGQRSDERGAIDNDGDGSCDAQDVSGGVLPNAPKWSGSLTTRYDQPIGSRGSVAFLQLTGRYQSEVQFQSDQHPLTKQEAYDIWDLRTGFTSPSARFEVAAYVKNLFAQSYVNNILALSLVNDRRDTLHTLPKAADRVFGVSLGLQW